MPGVREVLTFLRALSVPTALITNQSGLSRGLITPEDVEAVHRRMEELLGMPVGPKFVCPHGPDDGCTCRKPAPGLIHEAAAALGVDERECAVIGDVGSDMAAARAAGARGVLVPTPVTRKEEIEAADEVAADVLSAVRLLFEAPRATSSAEAA